MIETATILLELEQTMIFNKRRGPIQANVEKLLLLLRCWIFSFWMFLQLNSPQVFWTALDVLRVAECLTGFTLQRWEGWFTVDEWRLVLWRNGFFLFKCDDCYRSIVLNWIRNYQVGIDARSGEDRSDGSDNQQYAIPALNHRTAEAEEILIPRRHRLLNSVIHWTEGFPNWSYSLNFFSWNSNWIMIHYLKWRNIGTSKLRTRCYQSLSQLHSATK